MTPKSTLRLIDRLHSKLAELENQLTLSIDQAVNQYEEQKGFLREALQGLPRRMEGLEEKLAIDAQDVKQKLDQLEVQLELARMEAEEAYEKERRGLMQALSALESTLQKIEGAEDDEGLVHYKDFAKRVRRLDDKLGALHVHFGLDKTRTGEELDRAKEVIRGKLNEVVGQLKAMPAAAARDIVAIGKSIRENSEIMWGCLKEFMVYIETEEQRREREEEERKNID